MTERQQRKPLILAILDGWGVGPDNPKINAIAAANTPNFDFLMNNFPSTKLGASGRDVGLEENQMSGSEAGHLNIGAGRIVKQDEREILEDISTGAFFTNPVFLSMISHVKKSNSNVHIMGLMGTNDSPHAHPDIALALMTLMKHHGLEGRVFLHLFTDGRDSFPQSALTLWQEIWKPMIEKVGVAKLASVSGRFFAMDRAKNWDRLKKAYDVIVHGEGFYAKSIEDAIKENYNKGNTDEYFEPTVISDIDGVPTSTVKDNDGIIFFNFRSDRARQFAKFFVGKHCEKEPGFPCILPLKNISFVALTNFGPDLNLQTAYAIKPVHCTLPAAIGEAARQLYISETEKYAHVTYFINGGYADPLDGEDRVLIESPHVRSYAEKPEMSSGQITNIVLSDIEQDKYDVFVINYPNADMVGHTGDFEATVEAIECIDEKLGRLYQAMKDKEGTLIVTADHGNADIMIDEATGQQFTFHTKNPVPFIVASHDPDVKITGLSQGILGNIAPTILELLNIEKPEQMECDSLISHK